MMPSVVVERTRMRGAAAMLAIVLAAGALPAGAQMGAFPLETERDSLRFVVGGERHGVSFFPRVRHPQVEYEAGESLTFDRYHTVDVMYAWLRRWAEQYPDIVELYEVGRSFEGRPILQVTLTNRDTGAATDKPAAFFEGGRHSGEITSSESVLWLIRHLVEGYGNDARITALLDTKAIHLRPQNNPDGSNLYLHTAQANRSTVRPVDNDGDGLMDEDASEDLDGDGVVYQMRYRPADTAQATHVADEKDPGGRLMRPKRDGEVGVWRVLGEGVDSDGDGSWNEDGIGGLDLHRNYPENWRPMPGLDRTGRGYTQGGAGEFPLSETETRATVMFVLQNPNISVVNSMDTRVPMHLRPPSTSKGEERMYPEDLRLYEYFDSVGLSFTNYPWAGDVYWTYANRNRPEEEQRGSPLFGHGPDFGYFYYGAIWYGDELWNGGIFADENDDGERDQHDALIWMDREMGGNGFKAWTPHEHPTLGTVEIGGFHPKFFSQNGPPEVLEHWASRQALFNLEMAFHLPQLELEAVNTRRTATAGDSSTWEVTVRYRNAGQLPTALRQAQLVKIVREDRVELDFDSALTRGERPSVSVLDEGRSDGIEHGWLEPGQSTSVTIEVRTRGVPGVRGAVRIASTRGGVLREEFTLGEPAQPDEDRTR